MDTTGLLYDIQGYSVHDGPGIRTTVFLKGCPLRCPWCHSPESQSFMPQVCYRSASCLGTEPCGLCLEACPRGALAPRQAPATGNGSEYPAKRTIRIDRALCNDCADCAARCHSKALYLCGTEWTVEDTVARVMKDRAFYETSGGGVTLSGGEPLCQLPFAMEFLRACKTNGLHTALDTTGYVPWEAIESVLPWTDLFLYDLKHLDSTLHRRTVGVPNERILANARSIAQAGGSLQVRIPVIPRFNDSWENMERAAVFCKELGSAVACVQLLPYHTLGLAKYERLQEEGPVFEAPPMTDDQVQPLAEPFTRRGIPVTIH